MTEYEVTLTEFITKWAESKLFDVYKTSEKLYGKSYENVVSPNLPDTYWASNPNPGGGSLPTGLICMWSGLKATIPFGWALCDGLAGTPDLRDKFIVGVPDGEEAGITGGNLIKSHTGTAVTSHPATPTDVADVGATQRGTTATTLTLKAHKHNTPVLAHTVTQPSDHLDIRPPFFKLAFIMKT